MSTPLPPPFLPTIILIASFLCGAIATTLPKLSDMGGDWIEYSGDVRKEWDVPVLTNTWGAVGLGIQGKRPLSPISVSSLQIPPFSGCGDGCGELLVDGKRVDVKEVRWNAWEGGRRGGKGVWVESATRMVYEENAVMVRVNVTCMEEHVFDIVLQGPVVRPESMGTWSFPSPVANASIFTTTALSSGVLTTGGASASSSVHNASSYFLISSPTSHKFTLSSTNKTSATYSIKTSSNFSFSLVFGVGMDEESAKATVTKVVGEFDALWEEAREKWEEMWSDAFSPTTSSFFSGSLPLVSISPDIDRVYYTSALCAIAQLRTNLPIVAPRVFVNSAGNGQGAGVGLSGATAWLWDEGLVATLLSLLDPLHRPAMLLAWLQENAQGKANHMALDCFPPGSESCTSPTNDDHDDNFFPPTTATTPPTYFYPYSPWALFVNIVTYVKTSGNTTFLRTQIPGTSITVDEALLQIANAFPVLPNTMLVDTGPTVMDGFPSTYKHVLPGVQGNAAYMARVLAQLRMEQGREEEGKELELNATAFLKAAMTELYQPNRGWFGVVWPEKDGGKSVHEFRHVLDYFSMVEALCYEGDGGGCELLTQQDKDDMLRWVDEELVTRYWIRATSPYTNCSITTSSPTPLPHSPHSPTTPTSFPSIPTCNSTRQDHGSTGSYPAWVSRLAEATCLLGNCSLPLLSAPALAAQRQGPFGQAAGVPQLLKPPFTPNNSAPSYHPITAGMRFVGIEGGAFVDAIVRTYFSYSPPFLLASNATLQTLFMKPNNPRSFNGSLELLQTPLGLVNVTATSQGLEIVPSHG